MKNKNVKIGQCLWIFKTNFFISHPGLLRHPNPGKDPCAEAFESTSNAVWRPGHRDKWPVRQPVLFTSLVERDDVPVKNTMLGVCRACNPSLPSG
ncbi:MAG: hypothetical protein HQM12_07000 [SAR324 cluster bacterium]|nr:hypothetical protein [SAR324 cluster bacterium]